MCNITHGLIILDSLTLIMVPLSESVVLWKVLGTSLIYRVWEKSHFTNIVLTSSFQ